MVASRADDADGGNVGSRIGRRRVCVLRPGHGCERLGTGEGPPKGPSGLEIAVTGHLPEGRGGKSLERTCDGA